MSFISYLISGISLGSIYALIALGYTMVYGIAKMLNFAHGDIIMVGGYAVFTAMSTAWCPVWLSVIIGIVVCTVLGVVIEKVAYKPLRNAPPLASAHHRHRRQLPSPEPRTADFWFRSAEFHVCCRRHAAVPHCNG